MVNAPYRDSFPVRTRDTRRNRQHRWQNYLQQAAMAGLEDSPAARLRLANGSTASLGR
jgi:hypothetical protein